MGEETTPAMAIAGAAAQAPPDTAEAAPQKSEFTLKSSMVLAATSLGLFCTAGLINAFGVFQAYYTLHYLPHESDFQISWIGSFSIFILFGVGPPAGFLSDKIGPTIPVAIGAFCEVLALFMISLCTKYYQFFLAQGVLLGLGMAFILTPISAIPPRYFQKHRGLAQGICIGGSSLGGVLWPIMLDRLLTHDNVSFGWTLRIVAFTTLALLSIVLLGARHPPKPKSTSDETAKTSAAEEERKANARREGLKKLKHPSFVFLCLGLAIYYFGFFTPFFYVTTYGISLGISESFSIYLISILNTASLFGRILPGYISDRVGHFNILVVAMFGSCVVCFCWTAATTTAGLIVWSLAYGFISGAVLSLQLACASLVTTREATGAAFGIVMASIALTALFGTPIAGVIVERGYLALSMYCGAIMVAGGLLVTVARLSRSRELLAKV